MAIIIARILTVAAAILMLIWIALMIAGVDTTAAQDITTWATPVPVTPDVPAQVIEALVRALVAVLRTIIASLLG